MNRSIRDRSDYPAQHVAPELIGAEPVQLAGRVQHIGKVCCIGIKRRQHGSEQRQKNHECHNSAGGERDAVANDHFAGVRQQGRYPMHHDVLRARGSARP